MTADLVNRLRECDPSVYLQEEAAKEIERCHERLDIAHAWTLRDGEKVRYAIPYSQRASFPDGIECRNETIKLLDRNVATLRANATTAEQALASALGRLADIHTTAILYIGGEADTSHVAATGLIERIATIATTHPDVKP